MKNILELSNILFGWHMKKYGKWIITIPVVVGMIAMCEAYGNNPEKLPMSFLPYYMKVDKSITPILFILGLLGILITIFILMRGFHNNGKEIYTIFTLPMKPIEILTAFFIFAFSLVMLYFAVWVVGMVGMYVPVTIMAKQTAMELVLDINNYGEVTGLDPSITNGLYLSFQEGIFLSSLFPVHWIGRLLLVLGMTISTLGLALDGICTQSNLYHVGFRLSIVLGMIIGFFPWISHVYIQWQSQNISQFLGYIQIFGLGVMVLGLQILAIKYAIVYRKK